MLRYPRSYAVYVTGATAGTFPGQSAYSSYIPGSKRSFHHTVRAGTLSPEHERMPSHIEQYGTYVPIGLERMYSPGVGVKRGPSIDDLAEDDTELVDDDCEEDGTGNATM